MSNNLTRDEAQTRARTVSVQGYDVTLDLTTGEDAFASTTTVRFTAAEGSSTFLELIGTVSSLVLNGTALPLEAHDGFRISLEGLAADNVLEVVADCPYSHTGEGLHRFVDPVDGAVYTYTQFEAYEAHRVLACFDQPDLKAPWTLSVICPPDWLAVANTAPSTDAPGQWSFPTSEPISTYLYAVVAGPYHHVHTEHDGIPLGLYCRASLAEFIDEEELFLITRQGLDFFQELFDTRYPFSKYDQLFVPEFNAGAMENVGCVTFTESLLFRSKVTRSSHLQRAVTVLHEMAHMWFGDLVTMRWWDDLWLNESFATYASMHALVEATEFTEGWVVFAGYAKGTAAAADQLASTHPVVADAVDIRTAESNFDGITYSKGASLLKQLVAWVGEDAFYEGLRGYFREFAWGNTEFADLLRHLAAASGRELSGWRDAWLLTTGLNTLRPVFTLSEDGGTYTSFSVEQSVEPLRQHRLAVGLYALAPEGLVRQHRIELDVSGAATEVPDAVGLPVADLVLVNDDDLTYAKSRLDPQSMQTLVGHIAELQDPLARALCWSAAWDMTRDAELSTGSFTDLVLSGLAAETDTGVQERLLGQVRTAVLTYGSADHQSSRLARVSAAALGLSHASDAGSDRQLLLLQAAIGTTSDASWLARLLDGRETVEGVTFDTDLRWQVVTRLAVLGEIDSAGIEAELQRDATSAGELRAATCSAALADPGAKAKAWAAIVEDSALSNHEVNALISGFNQAEQGELLAAYVPLFFASLPDVWAPRSAVSANAQRQVTMLFPAFDVSAAALELVDQALLLELPSPLQRVLLDRRDGLVRSLACRAIDA